MREAEITFMPCNRNFDTFESSRAAVESEASLKKSALADALHANEAAAQDELAVLGVKLRHARTMRGMRLSDLATVSGCSESLLSKIENGKTIPSLNTLHSLAKGLGLTIAKLLSDDAAPKGIVMREGQRPVLSRMGLGGYGVDGVETELLIPFGADSALQATLLHVQPGARSDGLRQHEGDEVGYIVSGQITLTVEGESYFLKTGDAFFFPSMRPHGIANPGSSPAVIIWVNTPPTL
jgi:transcriptional regulator with XRE-family HTH domain